MKASVIIPVFNEEKTIFQTLESLKNQSFKDFETIVVDDGSTDSTKKIVKKFNIRLISQENKGPAAARNNGARNAGGEIIVFLDADCIASETWLEEMLKPFEDKKVAGVQGAYRSDQKNLVARFTQIEIEDRYDRLEKKKKNLDWIGSYSAAYRKKIFLKENGFDEDFPKASGEDPELSFKIAKTGFKLVFNKNAVVNHIHETSLVKYLKTKFYRAYWRVLLYSKHAGKIVGDSYTPQGLKAQIFIVFSALVFSALNIFLFSGKFSSIILFLIVVFFVTTIPFAFKALGKDFFVGIVSPSFIFFRSIVFGFGLAYGLVRGLWFAPMIKNILKK